MALARGGQVRLALFVGQHHRFARRYPAWRVRAIDKTGRLVSTSARYRHGYLGYLRNPCSLWPSADIPKSDLLVAALSAASPRSSCRSSGCAIGSAVGNARAYGTFRAEMPTVEGRLDALERNVTAIHERITATQKEIDEEIHRSTEALKREEEARRREDAETRKTLEATCTGGVHISAIGASWLFVGIILSTASPEIAAALRCRLTLRSTGRAGSCLQLGERQRGAPVTSNVGRHGPVAGVVAK